MTQVIQMISGPRNISTAMLYSFDSRDDCVGMDEPFYGYYLRKYIDQNHPGREEIINDLPLTLDSILDGISMQMGNTPYLFIKNMAHHIYNLPLDWAEDYKNSLLIRDPRRVLASFTKVITNPVASDIGIIQEWEIYKQLTDLGQQVPIIDTDQLLINPEHGIMSLCSALDIPYQTQMLTWKAGPRSIDGIWAKHWYDKVHQSDGLKTIIAKPLPTLSPKLQVICDEVMPYYEELKKLAL